MNAESPSHQGATRGPEVEAILWGLIARLRAQGWHISLWEIQRAQDIVAYLFARLQRPPTDDELKRHLRPILCGRDSELATFAVAFEESLPAMPIPEATVHRRQHRRRGWVFAVAVAAVLGVVIAVLNLMASDSGPITPCQPPCEPQPAPASVWSTWSWVLVAIPVAAVGVVVWFALHKRLRRRSEPGGPGHDLELRWATAHPLDTLECVRMARSLRARAREPGNALDIHRTVDATIRAGMRLSPRHVLHKRAPEYLAVIEQRSAQDVLAAYHAKVVDQLSVQGVAMRRVGLQPRSQLIVDPVRGRQQLETLQPTSDRERLLLFAHDWILRDPLSGEARSWLARFDRWSETTQIGADVDQDRALDVMDRVLTDVRCLDPAWARLRRARSSVPIQVLPAAFETGDQLWIEPCAPSSQEAIRALDLLVTSLGPNGWYWLSACALYPEINYELTVSLGSLLSGDAGEPVAAHVDISMLARLPWFRYAFMPDWLRATLISSMSHGQLVEARAALEQILVSGLHEHLDGSGSLTIAEARPVIGRGSPRRGEIAQDRVYLEGTALRRHRLAAAAPPQLVTAMRRHRYRLQTGVRPGEAPSRRVRRALAWCNGLLAIAGLASSILVALMVTDAAAAGDSSVFYDLWSKGHWWAIALVITLCLSYAPSTITFVYSLLARRRRGLILGGSSLVFLTIAIASLFVFTISSSGTAAIPAALLAARILTLIPTVMALRRSRQQGQPVTWPAFQKRNRVTFLVTTAALLCTLPLDAVSSGLWILVNMAVLPTLLASAYFAGVRIIPLMAGGLVLSISNAVMTDGLPLLFIGAPASILVLSAFYWQLRRVKEHPPLDFSETKWRKWKWPIAVATVAATATVTSFLDSNWTALLILTAIPAMWTALSAVSELLSNRLARAASRRRLVSWILFHLD